MGVDVNSIFPGKSRDLTGEHYARADCAIALREIEQQLRVSITAREALQQKLGITSAARDELQAKLRSRESELREVHMRLGQLSGELQSRDDEIAQSRALISRIYV
jgi:septal ring factor EnvC (AmiA/AmiB activator)